MVAMDRWVTKGDLPPDNQIPKVSDGTLVCPDQESTGFPSIRAVRYTGLHNRQLFLDYGPDLSHGRINFYPPRQEKNGEYRILVPKVDTDGNELAGIRLIPIRVPLATYTGWNLQGSRLAEDELCGLLGSTIPFAKTKYEREKNDDRRLSVEERYKAPVDYIQAIIRETESMVRDLSKTRSVKGCTMFVTRLKIHLKTKIKIATGNMTTNPPRRDVFKKSLILFIINLP